MSSSSPVFGNARTVRLDLAADLLRSHGGLKLRVMGWSMLPGIRPGDDLIVQRSNVDDIAKGDIVLFVRHRLLVAHRVVSKITVSEGARLQTRGDALSAPDPPLSESDLLGRVSLILRDGRRIVPSRTQRLSERLVSILIRNSETAARIFVHLAALRLTAQKTRRFQQSEAQVRNDRVIPCQS